MYIKHDLNLLVSNFSSIYQVPIQNPVKTKQEQILSNEH